MNSKTINLSNIGIPSGLSMQKKVIEQKGGNKISEQKWDINTHNIISVVPLTLITDEMEKDEKYMNGMGVNK